MSSSLKLVVGLTVAFALISAPGLVIGSLFLAAFALVLWKMTTHRKSPLRRGMGR